MTTDSDKDWPPKSISDSQDHTEVFSISDFEEVPRGGLLSLLSSEKYTDLSFIVEGKVFRAHRIIVASQSKYFDRLLFGSMKESKCSEIKLQDTPSEAFQLLLRYMYSGSVECTDLQNILDLLALSDRYDFKTLKVSIESNLCKKMTLFNVLQLMTYADVYNADTLYKQCAGFVDSNATSILGSHSMMILPKEHLKSLLLRDSFLASETEIFKAVKKWKEFNNLEIDEITDVLKCVRLTEIPYKELMDVVQPSGLYSESAIEEAVQQGQGQPRGKQGMNLFEDPSCTLNTYSNFKVSIIPEVFGKIDVELPIHLELTLMSQASLTPSVISFEFDDVYIIDQFVFDARALLWQDQSFDHSSVTPEEEIKNPYMYMLQVSKDGSKWTTIIDHSIFKCYFTQYLYFPRHAARFIRLIFTKAHEYLQLRFHSCSLLGNNHSFKFFDGGSIAPLEEMTPKYMSYWSPVKGKVKRCLLTFHQPYHISMIRLLIGGGMEKNPEHRGQVAVCLAVYNKPRNYRMVANIHHNFQEELVASFQDRLVSIVAIDINTYYNRVTGEDLTKTMVSKELQVSNFKICFRVT